MNSAPPSGVGEKEGKAIGRRHNRVALPSPSSSTNSSCGYCVPLQGTPRQGVGDCPKSVEAVNASLDPCSLVTQMGGTGSSET